MCNSDVVVETKFLQSLLHDPNVNSPANNEAAKLYRENRREYEKRVAAIVQESWAEDADDIDDASDVEPDTRTD